MAKPENKFILDLCGGTGGWSAPYAKAGYNVVIVDPLAEPSMFNFCGTVQDFYEDLLRENKVFPHFHGVLFAPPCTEFSGSGARWWKDKDPKLLKEAIHIVRIGLKIIKKVHPKWWCLENPVGRLAKCVPELGHWKMIFQPNQYGDPYTKNTCLWGEFNSELKKNVVEVTQGSKMHLMPPSEHRKKDRAVTPPGFARKFKKANP